MSNRVAHFQIGLCLVAGFILAPLAAYFNGKSLPAQEPIPVAAGKPPCDVRENAEANVCPTVSP
ncbi:MAG: hypothetical protein HYS17_08935 [Micavibrio aeruginosavorus]|uniref:Uncharacterized protein n=1 Tax=Micavibrio aeruginosavorus TaxID=349221 RepID=A0A7T5R1A5_9BACT|nr:MAG: hypothetical protein HYS17_08935 [Micavibrio aeruginosavorus]